MKVKCPNCKHEFDTHTLEIEEISRTTSKEIKEFFDSMTDEAYEKYLKDEANAGF